MSRIEDLNDPGWKDFSWEVSSVDAATRAADEDGVADEHPDRVGKPSPRYDRRRGYSVPPVKVDAPQIYATEDGRWRMFNVLRHQRDECPDRSRPWLLQRRVQR